MKYKGSCHCKAIQFEFEHEPIQSALKCNCSICARKNALMSESYVDPNKFKLVKGKEVLANYRWGDKDVNHYFCPICGIHSFHDTIYDKEKYRINLNCVENLDTTSLIVTHFDGKNNL